MTGIVKKQLKKMKPVLRCSNGVTPEPPWRNVGQQGEGEEKR
jgi:hypothetical protein